MPLISRGRFNGGTITGTLEVDPASAGQSALIIHADPTDPVNTAFIVDQHGNLTINSGGSFQEAFISLRDNTSGNPGAILIDTFLGIVVGPEGSANTLLRLSPTASHTGLAFRVQSVIGAETLRVSADNKIGFYDHAVAAQSSVTSGTVTPEQLALALQANGLLGGT